MFLYKKYKNLYKLQVEHITVADYHLIATLHRSALVMYFTAGTGTLTRHKR